jgi:hypothetical protein
LRSDGSVAEIFRPAVFQIPKNVYDRVQPV